MTKLSEQATTQHRLVLRFWSYIKIKRKDNTGIAPLKNGENVYTNAKHKACILNINSSLYLQLRIYRMYHS